MEIQERLSGKENCFRAYTRTGPDRVPSFYRAVQFVNVSALRDRLEDGTDWFGVRWVEMVPDYRFPVLTDVANWGEVIKFPDLDALDWKAAAERDCAGLDRENKLIWAPLRVGPFERIHSFMGMDTALLCLYTEPEAMHGLIEAYVDYRMKVIDKVIGYYDPDIVSIHDDYGTQLDLFMSPEMWREFFKPGLRRFVERVHEAGKLFCMHSCGKVDRVVGDFVEIGVDFWDSVQPCCDLDEIYRLYGKDISFSPAMDLQKLSYCGTDEARAMAREVIDQLGKHGNVIPRDDSPLVPPENLDAIKDEVEKYGRDYYRAS